MNDTMCHPYNHRSGLSWLLYYPHRTDMEDYMSLIQLTRGQEETVNRIVTALEKIAEHTGKPTEPSTSVGESRWRKCSQELPEENTIVLCIVMRSDRSYYYALNYRSKGSWVKTDYPEYWMPLPRFEEV